jgi:type VI secretion system lysozyme-like protein
MNGVDAERGRMWFGAKLKGDRESCVESIARNLQAILNAKDGHSAATPSFGLGRYDGYLSSQLRLETLCAEMLEQVRSFEPRIANPTMEMVGRDANLWLHFRLTGLVAQGTSSFAVLFHCVYRNVHVRPG